MESIVSYFSGIGIDFWVFLRISGMILLGGLLFLSLIRIFFKRTTLLSSAMSSSIAIIFIYVVMVLILTAVTELHFLVTPLPFASISSESLRLFCFEDASYTTIASELLSMIILAFLVSLADTWLPKGRNILTWTWWRTLTVVIGFLLHYAASVLIHRYLPYGIVLYAPVILLVILMIMLLTGALRFILGLVLATVNPLIAALYTFFFATMIGKQLTKSVLTTGILTGVVLIMQKMGITELAIMPEALIAYVPFLLLLIPVWYLACRL